MTVKLLNDILKENNIPEDVVMWSDSGWECDATDMDCIYYNKIKNNSIILNFSIDNNRIRCIIKLVQ